MKKMNNKKGFTLAELLIVVAIIAVLVAISIPIFTTQLEKSRESTDAANIRAAYAEVMSAALSNDGEDAKTNASIYTLTGEASGQQFKYTSVVTLGQKQNGWQNTSITDIGGISVKDMSPNAGSTCTIVYDEAAATPLTITFN